MEHVQPVDDFCNDNICACAVSALILLPVANISRKMDLATPISYMTLNFSRPTLLFVYFSDFSLRMLSFDHNNTSGLRYDVIFQFSAPVCYEEAVISGTRRHFQQL